jgi:hypothetical protein
MSGNNTNGKVDLTNLIPTIWSKRFYEAFKSQTQLVSLFSREYEGEIKDVGDTVKVNTLILEAAQTLTDDKQKFKASKVQVSQKSLTVNRRTIHAVEITSLAQLQSIPFMENLKKEMTYQLMLKMEQEVIAEMEANFTAYAIAGAAYTKDDLIDARTKAVDLLWGRAAGRYSCIGASYYGALLKSSVLTSVDFVPGKALMDQQLPNVFGMQPFEHDGVANKVAYHFHYTAIQMAVQQGVNFEMSSLHSQNKKGFLLSVDIVWDMETFDSTRGFMQKDAGAAIGV